MNAKLQAQPAQALRILDNAQSWYGTDMAKTTQWVHEFSAQELRELDHAIKAAVARQVDLVDMRAADFPLDSLAARLQRVRDDILHGRGFALLRGLPAEGYSLQEKAYAFRGIGAHFGEAVSQNAKGHVLGHVTNLGLDYADPTTRGYQTKADLRFHTDASDIVGLLCVQSSRSGGLSRIASSTTVWNEIVQRRPDLAAELCRPYCFTRWGEIGAGQKAFAELPLFQECQGMMISMLTPSAIEKAQALPGVPALEPRQREAIAMVEQVAGEDGIRLDMAFRPGDMQFLLNHTTFHSRTAYEDWPELERRRHLLRLWLACPTGPQLPAYMTDTFQGRTASGRPNGIAIPGVPLKASLVAD